MLALTVTGVTLTPVQTGASNAPVMAVGDVVVKRPTDKLKIGKGPIKKVTMPANHAPDAHVAVAFDAEPPVKPVQPPPAVMDPAAAKITPIINSTLFVVVTGPLSGDVLVPLAPVNLSKFREAPGTPLFHSDALACTG